MDLDYIKTQLERRRGERQLSRVAEQTGITLRTLLYILEGKKPRYSTIEVLHPFLKKTSRKRVL